MDVLASIPGHIVDILCTTIVTGAVAYITKSMRKERKERQEEKAQAALQKSALLGLLHDSIFQACQFYILTDQIELDEIKNLEKMYIPYKALGGNDVCERLYERCLELPIVEKRTKWKD